VKLTIKGALHTRCVSPKQISFQLGQWKRQDDRWPCECLDIILTQRHSN